MKGFFKFLLITLLILVTLTIVLSIGLGIFVYNKYLIPKEATFEFRNTAENIAKIEIVDVTLKDEDWDFALIADVEDKTAFLADFAALKCYKGIPMKTLENFSQHEEDPMVVRSIKITYNDESFDLISSIGNIDSDYDINKILAGDFFSFDFEEFDALIAKYQNK